jgi:hypothetical protein
MQISKIHILPTDNTPEIILNPEGIIKIKGRGMVLKHTESFDLAMEWLDGYMLNPAETTLICICFEYLNSFCTVRLVHILQKISKVTLQNKKYSIHWYYEEEDEDILERGEYISSSFDMPITFILTSNIKNCC